MYVFPCGPQVFACFRMFSFFRTQHRRISQIIGASRFSRFFMILQFPAKWCFLQRVACTSVLCIPEKKQFIDVKNVKFSATDRGGHFPPRKLRKIGPPHSGGLERKIATKNRSMVPSPRSRTRFLHGFPSSAFDFTCRQIMKKKNKKQPALTETPLRLHLFSRNLGFLFKINRFHRVCQRNSVRRVS